MEHDGGSFKNGNVGLSWQERQKSGSNLRVKFFSKRERQDSICQNIDGTSHFKNVNNCLNTNIYSYLQKSGGQSSNL